jgi:hypothetical protein
MAQGAQDGALGDAMIAVRPFPPPPPSCSDQLVFEQHFPRAYPHLRAHHVFPGYVYTQAPAAMGLLPRPLLWVTDLVGPLAARVLPFANTPTTFSDIPVYLAANEAAKGKGLEFTNQALKSVGAPKWAEQEKGGVAEKVWEKLKGIVERET